MSIIKADGTVEDFDPSKLIASLKRTGADPRMAEDIADSIGRTIKEGMTTHDIYQHAFATLKEHRREVAARYSLKRAMLEFGPTGFPFEAYLAELYRAKGYEASTDRHIRGKCVEHEIDVVLSRDGEEIFVEAKFHNSAGFKTDLQVALYVQARLEDIIDKIHAEDGGDGKRRLSGMLVTNTKFTSLAIQYAECRNLALLGWEYPLERNLNDLIHELRLYPITVLTALSHGEKESLLASRVVLCRDLARSEHALAAAGVRGARVHDILMEAGSLCSKNL